MAVSVGVLVFFGILLTFIFLAALCVGTGNPAVESLLQRLGLKSEKANGQEKTERGEVVGSDFADVGHISPREEKLTIQEDTRGRYDVNPGESDEENLDKEVDETQEDYDYPAGRAVHVADPLGLDPVATESGPSDGGTVEESSSTEIVYQNAKIGKVTPRPAPRRDINKKVEEEDQQQDFEQLYQNVSVGK